MTFSIFLNLVRWLLSKVGISDFDGGVDLDSIRPPESPIFDSDKEKINKVVADLKDHPWAGHYFHDGGGLGNDYCISLSPELEFYNTIELGGYLMERDCGSIDKNGNILIFTPRLSDDNDRYSQFDERFFLVPWGDRKYLIAEKSLISFCNSINYGLEPINSATGSVYYLRKGDHEIKVSGFPDLPEKYYPYLLQSPIEAEILKFGDSAPNNMYPPNEQFSDTIALLSVGSQDGVLEGMAFYISETDENFGQLITRNIQEDSCLVDFTHRDDFDLTTAVGWKLSTRSPQHS